MPPPPITASLLFLGALVRAVGHIPAIVGIGDEAMHEMGPRRRRAKSPFADNDDDGCDITLWPNLVRAENPTSFALADGTVYRFDEGFSFSDLGDADRTGGRFLIPGNGLFYDREATDPAGRYFGTITYLDTGTTTYDLLTIVLDGEGDVSAAGYTVRGSPERYVLAGGSGKFFNRAGTMTIADFEDGIPFCLRFKRDVVE